MLPILRHHADALLISNCWSGASPAEVRSPYPELTYTRHTPDVAML